MSFSLLISSARLCLLTLACGCVLGLSAGAQPTPPPFPDGPPGHGDPPGRGGPPRATPGLDPATLAGIAAAGYLGFRFYRNRGGK
jgi:hypothetical protein